MEPTAPKILPYFPTTSEMFPLIDSHWTRIDILGITNGCTSALFKDLQVNSQDPQS